MTARLLLLLLASASSLAQNPDYDDSFDWLKFFKGTENEYEDDWSSEEEVDTSEEWDVGRPLDVVDRSLSKFEHPLEKLCEVHQKPVQDSYDPYEYTPRPKYNVTCRSSTITDHENYSRYRKDKEFCVLIHQRPSAHNLCQTVYTKIPVSRRKKGSFRWTSEYQTFGIGCRCYRPIGPWHDFRDSMESNVIDMKQ